MEPELKDLNAWLERGAVVALRERARRRREPVKVGDASVNGSILEDWDVKKTAAEGCKNSAGERRIAVTGAESRAGILVPTRTWDRRRGDVLWLLVGLGVFAAAAAAATGGLAPGERAVFKAVNSLPNSLYAVIWPFMQYGVFLTIPVLTGIALILRRVRLAAAMAVAGVGVYLIAKVGKEIVQRGRPEALVGGIAARETFAANSLGFPSGHVAVAAALTVVVTPYLAGRWKVVPAALAVIVAVGRMYVGAHTPLDLIGGAALGVSAGCVANLLVGTPTSAEREMES
jgi:membrane-associated phospholipid phosphatase